MEQAVTNPLHIGWLIGFLLIYLVLTAGWVVFEIRRHKKQKAKGWR